VDATRSFARRFHLLTALRTSLVLGAFYDLVFAALMVFWPRFAADVFGLPLPGERFYLWIMAVFLIMLASLYLAAARDPRRYSVIVAVAIGGRALGAIAFGLAAWGQPELASLWLLAGADLAFAAAHGGSWIPLVT
jgi:hypothetical protein